MASGYLTTHVLDTMHGHPAAGMRIDLLTVHAETPEHIITVTTNADGRCDGPLLEGEHFKTGVYELLFDVGAYFYALGVPADRQFLGVVPVRFVISEADSHYHVPLLVSPYGYSTYRGS